VRSVLRACQGIKSQEGNADQLGRPIVQVRTQSAQEHLVLFRRQLGGSSDTLPQLFVLVQQ